MLLDKEIVTLVGTLELSAIEVPVDAPRSHQLIMGAALGNPPVDHDDNLICATDRGEPMGNNNRRASHQGDIECPLNGLLALGVKVGSSFVQDQYPGCLEEKSGKGDSLLLSAREPVTSIADNRVQTIGERGDQVSNLGGAASFQKVVLSCIRSSVEEIGPD